jgi:hypothetical protein
MEGGVTVLQRRQLDKATAYAADAYLFRRHRRNMDHFIMQILTEHGIFYVISKND